MLQTRIIRRDGRMSRASVARFGRSGNPNIMFLDPNQTNAFKIDTCHFLASHLALLGYGKDWLAQCQDNVAEWDIKSQCGGLTSQWGSTIKLLRVHTDTSQYPLSTVTSQYQVLI